MIIKVDGQIFMHEGATQNNGVVTRCNSEFDSGRLTSAAEAELEGI